MLNEAERIEFGRYLRALREGADRTLRAVQRDCQISPGYLSLVESGSRNPPSDEFLIKLARYYGAPAHEVLARAGRKREPDAEDLAMDNLERAYQFVIADKRFKHGNRMVGEPTPEVKRFMVEMYQRLTNLSLLDESIFGKKGSEEPDE